MIIQVLELPCLNLGYITYYHLDVALFHFYCSVYLNVLSFS